MQSESNARFSDTKFFLDIFPDIPLRFDKTVSQNKKTNRM